MKQLGNQAKKNKNLDEMFSYEFDYFIEKLICRLAHFNLKPEHRLE